MKRLPYSALPAGSTASMVTRFTPSFRGSGKEKAPSGPTATFWPFTLTRASRSVFPLISTVGTGAIDLLPAHLDLRRPAQEGVGLAVLRRGEIGGDRQDARHRQEARLGDP